MFAYFFGASSVILVSTFVTSAMKVLIGIDGSEHSFAAAGLAGRLLAEGRDEVLLYHSCVPLTLAESVDESLHDRACRAVANVIFEEAKSRLPEPLRTGASTVVDEENASGALASAAEKFGADLVVLGARGLGRIQGLLLGSVSSSVVRSSRVPVLVARGERRDSDALRVLVAYDPINAARHAGFLAQLSWPANTSGSVVSVIEAMLPSRLPDWIQKRARDADTEAMSQVWVREHQDERDAKLRELTAYVKQLPAGFQSGAPLVAEGNPAEQLLATIEREQPSIVVVGKAMKNLFDRWFIGSVSEKILSHAGCSVLVIPAGAG